MTRLYSSCHFKILKYKNEGMDTDLGASDQIRTSQRVKYLPSKLLKNLVRTSNTTHYKYQLVNAVLKIIAVYSENHTKPLNTKHSVTDC
jgi:hypothetical protein